MLADMPADALAWAPKNMRDHYTEKYAPPPAIIKQGLDHYIERKEELGSDFSFDQVYPHWVEGS